MSLPLTHLLSDVAALFEVFAVALGFGLFASSAGAAFPVVFCGVWVLGVGAESAFPAGFNGIWPALLASAVLDSVGDVRGS